ncbi:MAG: nucleotidyltransferase domain-containing protein [Nanoarchaeota archaeon]|nr:nucleotidyltransferase domain-containing protein [Nanoarchaeota archaeon]
MNPANQNIPGMNLDQKYSDKNKIIPENTEKIQKEMDKTRKDLEKLKSFITKKYPFTLSISILPPQIIKKFVDEEEIPKETEKYIQLYVLIPEEKFKEIPKIKAELVKQMDSINKQKIWLQIKTPVDIWENCIDGKFDLVSGVAMSFPLYDKGFLGALRICEIHKSLVLQKFEKYVVSYVIAGSFLRGEATKESDVDVFVIINDTDVKRMPRLELKERLRGIIAGVHLQEATALAGVKNTLHIQTYLLTDFWESVKDAHPVIFTFIRDGIPIYDRGTFMPWKALLKMGKLKPSPEAIDMFMRTAEKTKEMVDRRLIDAMIDMYYGILTPSQALIMLHGNPPPTHKETPILMQKIFVEKEKMLEKKYINILEKVVRLFKEYEHEKLKKISGKEIDKLIQESEDYLKRLKELREQIEKKSQEKTIEQIYKDVFDLLKTILGKKSQDKIIKDFEKELVKTGKFTQQHLRILNDIIKARAEFKKGKSSSHKVNEARKNASILINDLIEYSQRCELISLEKGRMRIKYKEKGKESFAELLHCKGRSFLITGNTIKRLDSKVSDSNMKEVNEALEKQRKSQDLDINPNVFELLKKEIGNFEIIL